MPSCRTTTAPRRSHGKAAYPSVWKEKSISTFPTKPAATFITRASWLQRLYTSYKELAYLRFVAGRMVYYDLSETLPIENTYDFDKEGPAGCARSKRTGTSEMNKSRRMFNTYCGTYPPFGRPSQNSRKPGITLSRNGTFPAGNPIPG